jgi:hypothetical protein
VRHERAPFNEKAAGIDDTVVLCVSADLPFAMGRFCGAEGIENVKVGSTFRSDFGADYGVTLTDGKLQGVLARAVVVIGPDGTVKHTELVPRSPRNRTTTPPSPPSDHARGQTRDVSGTGVSRARVLDCTSRSSGSFRIRLRALEIAVRSVPIRSMPNASIKDASGIPAFSVSHASAI